MLLSGLQKPTPLDHQGIIFNSTSWFNSIIFNLCLFDVFFLDFSEICTYPQLHFILLGAEIHNVTLTHLSLLHFLSHVCYSLQCCVFWSANTCLRMRSHGRKQWKMLENYQKSTFFIVRMRDSRKAHIRTWRKMQFFSI